MAQSCSGMVRSSKYNTSNIPINLFYINSQNLPCNFELLAWHYKEGKHYSKALEYLIQAISKAFKNFALSETLQFIDEAFKIMPNVSSDFQSPFFKANTTKLLRIRGSCYQYMGNREKAVESYKAAISQLDDSLLPEDSTLEKLTEETKRNLILLEAFPKLRGRCGEEYWHVGLCFRELFHISIKKGPRYAYYYSLKALEFFLRFHEPGKETAEGSVMIVLHYSISTNLASPFLMKFYMQKVSSYYVMFT